MIDESQIDVDKEITERFATLPKVVQDAITSADIEKRLRTVSDKHKLHIDQWQILQNEVMLTLLGMQDVSELAEEIHSAVGITTEEANSLTEDLNTIVFEPIRQELERQLESPDAKDKVLTGAETAREEILAKENAAVTAVAAPTLVPGTPPVPAPTQKATRAPLSSAYTARQPSTERKIVEGDPYRETPK